MKSIKSEMCVCGCDREQHDFESLTAGCMNCSCSSFRPAEPSPQKEITQENSWEHTFDGFVSRGYFKNRDLLNLKSFIADTVAKAEKRGYRDAQKLYGKDNAAARQDERSKTVEEVYTIVYQGLPIGDNLTAMDVLKAWDETLQKIELLTRIKEEK